MPYLDENCLQHIHRQRTDVDEAQNESDCVHTPETPQKLQKSSWYGTQDAAQTQFPTPAPIPCSATLVEGVLDVVQGHHGRGLQPYLTLQLGMRRYYMAG